MDYSTLKVTELKDELKKRNIPTTKLSRKQEFIDRLLEDDAESGNAKDIEEAVIPDAAPGDIDGAEQQAGATDGQLGGDDEGNTAPVASSATAQEPQGPIDAVNQPEENKRKRRSNSPVPSEGSVSKKLKQSEADPVHFEQDTIRQSSLDEKDAMEVDPTALPQVEPSKHAPTAAIYIRDLIRPLNAAQLKSHILTLINAPDDDTAIVTFHLDSLKTHAFILFSSASQAALARALLHNTIFPPEPTRKPLWVDFITEEQVAFFIETERTTAGPRANDSKRWEVMYSGADGAVIAELVDVTARSLPIPTGPAAGTDGSSAPRADIDTAGPFDPTEPLVLSTLPLSTLQSSFPSTSAQPPLFFTPVPEPQVSARLQALADATSPAWDPREDHKRNLPSGSGGAGTAVGVGGGRGLDQLRRYTFQDGAEIVDGGAEFGGGKAFGRDRGGAIGGALGGRRGGIGGGGGGGGPPRGGDRYRVGAGAGDDYGRYEWDAGGRAGGHGPPPPPSGGRYDGGGFNGGGGGYEGYDRQPDGGLGSGGGGGRGGRYGGYGPPPPGPYGGGRGGGEGGYRDRPPYGGFREYGREPW